MARGFAGLADLMAWRSPGAPAAAGATVCQGSLPEGPLSEWNERIEGIVVEVLGCSRLAARLREIGVMPGARVRVLRVGCPTVIQVEEGRFCIRRRDAASIQVRPTRFDGMAEPGDVGKCHQGRHRRRGRRSGRRL